MFIHLGINSMDLQCDAAYYIYIKLLICGVVLGILSSLAIRHLAEEERAGCFTIIVLWLFVPRNHLSGQTNWTIGSYLDHCLPLVRIFIPEFIHARLF